MLLAIHMLARVSLALVLAGAVFAAACGGGSSTPTSPSGERPDTPTTINVDVTLTAGQRATVEGTPLSLEFVGVSADSRCPADAFCVRLGEAVAVFEAAVSARGGARLELRTTEAGRRGDVGDFRVELRALEPYPFSSRPIDPATYRASVHVSSR